MIKRLVITSSVHQKAFNCSMRKSAMKESTVSGSSRAIFTLHLPCGLSTVIYGKLRRKSTVPKKIARFFYPGKALELKAWRRTWRLSIMFSWQFRHLNWGRRTSFSALNEDAEVVNQTAEMKAKYLTTLMSIPKEWHRSMLFYTIKVSTEDKQSFIGSYLWSS